MSCEAPDFSMPPITGQKDRSAGLPGFGNQFLTGMDTRTGSVHDINLLFQERVFNLRAHPMSADNNPCPRTEPFKSLFVDYREPTPIEIFHYLRIVNERP